MTQKISQFTAAAALAGTEQLEVSQLSTTVTLTAIDISALAVDNSYNSVAGAFITSGFAVGNTVRVIGFASSVNNINSGTITALTAAKMTIGGTDGDVIIDGAAGPSVTISKWDTRRTTELDLVGNAVNAQTGTTYTYLTGDRGKLVSHTNAAAIAGTLPQAGANFPSKWRMWVQNRGAGTLTITPTTSTIDGAANLALTANQGCMIVSDGTNYFSMRGVGSASGGGSTQGRHAIFIAAGSMAPSITGGCATLARIASAANQPDIASLDFDTTTQEYAQFYLTMPKSWNEGTVTFAPVWSHAATTVNFGVVFDLQAVAVSDLDLIAVAYGTAVTSTDTGGTTNTLYMGPESAAITVAGTPANEDTVFFRVSRVVANAGDTMAIDARLMGIVLYITTNADTDA